MHHILRETQHKTCSGLASLLYTVSAAALLAICCGAEPRDAAQRVVARAIPCGIEIENGIVRACFVQSDRGVAQEFFARNSEGEWTLVAKSLELSSNVPGKANKLFDESVSPNRILANSHLESAKIIAQSIDKCEVELTGRTSTSAITQRIVLTRGSERFHIEVTAAVDGQPTTLEYLLSCYEIWFNGPPCFVHSPTLKFDHKWPAPVGEQVLGDRCFHSPAVILQKGSLFAALVPDLNSINHNRVQSPDARRQMLIPRNQFSIPIINDKYTMPTALDLDLESGITPHPVVSFGILDYLVQQHVRYLHPHDGSMVRTLKTANVRYEFDLFLSADKAEYDGYQDVSQYIWQVYGHPEFEKTCQLAMPFTEYVRTISEATFQPLEVQPGVPGYRNTGSYLEFELDGRPVGGFRNAAPFWLDVLSNSEFWNNVRDAVGMYEWGVRMEDPSLIERARRIINLALCAPQNRYGLFPLIYRAESHVWQLDSYDASRGGYAFITSGHDSQTYNVVAMSKTCAHLLSYRERCQADPRIIPFVKKYADWLLTVIDKKGVPPSYVGSDMKACAALRDSAQCATSMWFLAELYRATNDRKYLDGADRIAKYLQASVLPKQIWTDLEQYFSCGSKPLDFVGDRRQLQPARGNLSIAWAAQGFASLWKATGSEEYLLSGERTIDYLAFTQCSWNPHFVYTARPFGGFTVDNADTATFLDARQGEFGALFAWYGKTLGRQDLLERGVAAGRASVVLINHPRHKANGIYEHTNIYPLGLGPENIDHEGHPQSAMRTSPSWGEGSGIFTGLAGLEYELGGAYVDFNKNVAVGVDGVKVKSFSRNGNEIRIAIVNQLRELVEPYLGKCEIELIITGLPSGRYDFFVNEQPPRRIDVKGSCRIPVIVRP